MRSDMEPNKLLFKDTKTIMLKSIGLLVIGTVVAWTETAWGQNGTVSAQRIREHTRYLSTDQMEGRGVGERGGQLATEYIANQLALAGAKPAGDDGTYFQKVPLVGVETQPESELNAAVWGKGISFQWGEEFVGVNHTQRPNARFEGEAVFVGHGISAPEFK